MQARDSAKLVEKCVLGAVDAVLASPPRDLETIFAMSFALLQDAEAKATSALAPRLVDALVRETKHAELKLSLLATLYGLRSMGAEQRLRLLVQLLGFAARAGATASVLAQLGALDAWLAECKAEDADRADVYAAAAAVCRVSGKQEEEAAWSRRALQCLDKADAKRLALARDLAVTVALHAVRSPQPGDCEATLRLKAVRQLSGDKAVAPLVQLLEALVRASLEDVTRLFEKERDALSKLHVDEQAALRKCRFALLCNVASEGAELPYREAQRVLQLRDSFEVEQVVIEAVVAGLVDVRMDQERQMIAVLRTTRPPTWDRLAHKLALWKDNVAAVLGVLSATRAGHAHASAPAAAAAAAANAPAPAPPAAAQSAKV